MFISHYTSISSTILPANQFLFNSFHYTTTQSITPSSQLAHSLLNKHFHYLLQFFFLLITCPHLRASIYIFRFQLFCHFTYSRCILHSPPLCIAYPSSILQLPLQSFHLLYSASQTVLSSFSYFFSHPLYPFPIISPNHCPPSLQPILTIETKPPSQRPLPITSLLSLLLPCPLPCNLFPTSSPSLTPLRTYPSPPSPLSAATTKPHALSRYPPLCLKIHNLDITPLPSTSPKL